MALDPSIILGNRGVDVVGAMGAGNALAAQTNQLQQQNALAQLYKTQGAGIMNGDPNALNALAAIDPAAGQGFKTTARDMAWREEDRAAAKAEGQRMAEEAMKANADKLTAEQLAAEQEAITKGLSGAAFFYQNGDKKGYDAFLVQQGLNPAELPFDQFPAHAAMFEGVLDAMKTFAGQTQGTEYGLTPIYGRNANGDLVVMQPGKDGTAVATKLPEGVTPDLSIKTEESARGAAVGKASGEALAALPGAKEAVNLMDSQIKSILDDPYLDNMIGAFDSRMPNITSDAARVQSKLDQLGGTAFLQAYQMLRGGGAITEIEGQRATDALARMNAAQNEADFRQALLDFQAAVKSGIDKLAASSTATTAPGSGSPPPATGFDQAEIDQLMIGP